MGPLVRVAVVGAGAVVLSAAAVGGGLWLSGNDPDVPESGDVHAAATGCDAVTGELLAELLPGAVAQPREQGPLEGGDNLVCAWSSPGAPGGDGGALRVDVSALFTDATGEEPVTGAERAAEAYTALLPVRAEEVDLPTGEGAVWHGQVPGTSELAFHSDNLFVRVSYAGLSGQEPVDPGDAADLAAEFAGRIGESL
ncbi:hypothetical protein ACIRPH_23090 [Nocardiopsis sp. NPDC101807]|uniref:hypothetical protein n=1 Tax=Nocardiopsis sp. NPDC101807 TaxID=3364339 RepID=UPI003810AB5A